MKEVQPYRRVEPRAQPDLHHQRDRGDLAQRRREHQEQQPRQHERVGPEQHGVGVHEVAVHEVEEERDDREDVRERHAEEDRQALCPSDERVVGHQRRGAVERDHQRVDEAARGGVVRRADARARRPVHDFDLL